jgi:hypothetical protein
VTELPIERVLLDGILQLERLGIQYAVMGGFAARAWGLPRPTFDADIAVATDADGLQRLFAALEGVGFEVPPEHKTGFLDSVGGFQKAKVNRFADGHVWSTDLFVVEGAFLHSALARARLATIAGSQVRVMAPEDIILLKLIANRRKDLADIEEVIAVCDQLDLTYLREWADRLDVRDRLAEFFPRQT